MCLFQREERRLIMNEITRKYFEEEHIVRELEHIESFVINECESPMEELFAIAFYSYGAKDFVDASLHYHFDGKRYLVIRQQMKVEKYRADFLIEIKGGNVETSYYVVEIDGHDFHEKTKEQVKRRNERDRFFASKGMTVIRFSGSEVYNDPDGCVESVCECIIDNEINKERKRKIT